MQCNLAKTMKISLLMSCLALFGCSNDSEVADKIKASHGEPLNTGDTYTKPRTIENFYDYVEFLKNKAAQNKSNNNKVTTSVSKKVSKKEAIDLILRGKLGDGPERIEKLKKLGFTDSEVKEIQKSVTKIINEEDQIKTDFN